MIREGERLEEIGFGGLKLIQKPKEFCYGVDAVLLADFACSFCPEFRRSVDLGTGTGIVPLIMSHKGKNKEAILTGIEFQESYVDMASRSCRLNSLDDRVSIAYGDVTNIEKIEGLSKGCADVVTSNPPYVQRNAGIFNDNMAKYLARHESIGDIEDFIGAAAWLIGERGHLFLVHRPSRLVDIFYYCREYGLEPKHLRLVAPFAGKTPNIALIHCAMGGGRELELMDRLYVYDGNGSYTRELERIYQRI